MPTIPKPTVKFLVTAAHQAPSADNSQPWHLTWDGVSLSLRYDVDRVSGLTFQADDPATLLSMGGVIENLTQAASHLGLHLQQETTSEADLKAVGYFQMVPELKDSVEIPDNSYDLPLFYRHTNRLAFKNDALPADLLATIMTEHELNARALIISDPEKIRAIARLVRSASEIRFQTKEVHEWLGKSLRFNDTEEYGDGLDTATLDLPPGGGVFLRFITDWGRMAFLNRFGIFKILSMVEAGPISKAPALMVITCPAGAEQLIAAGRLLTRIWTRLNAEGIAVHPYYVISDQIQRLEHEQIPDKLVSQAKKLKLEASRIFDLNKGSREIQMLLRVGYPKKEPVRSRRLSLQTVFTDISK